MERYSRQMILIGDEAQAKLTHSKVLIVGAGGLGSPISLYLAGAGVGTIGIMDDDKVSLSNLHRQVLYSTPQIGENKIFKAAQRLTELNDQITIVPYCERLTKENAAAIIAQYDMVIDGTDNFATRYLINDICKELKKPYLYGAIFAHEGQIALFDYTKDVDYQTIYPDRDYYEHYQAPHKGVIGTTPGVVGTLIANEAIKYLTSIGEPLVNKLLVINLLSLDFSKVSL